MADEYFTIGEPILAMRKAFNIREGITPKDYFLEPFLMGHIGIYQKF